MMLCWSDATWRKQLFVHVLDMNLSRTKLFSRFCVILMMNRQRDRGENITKKKTVFTDNFKICESQMAFL